MFLKRTRHAEPRTPAWRGAYGTHGTHTETSRAYARRKIQHLERHNFLRALTQGTRITTTHGKNTERDLQQGKSTRYSPDIWTLRSRSVAALPGRKLNERSVS